jgi:hypothetical protein
MGNTKKRPSKSAESRPSAKDSVSPAENRAATIQFFLGLALGLLPSGLGMIGITVNLWWGAALLLVCFVLIAGALWIWAASLPSWQRMLRSTVVIVATVAYASLIGSRLADRRNTPDPALSLSIVTSMGCTARSNPGPFSVVYHAPGPPALTLSNFGFYLRVVNRQDYPVRIEKCTAEVATTNGDWLPMQRVPMIGAKAVYWGTSTLDKMYLLDMSKESFEWNTEEPIPARGSTSGWMLWDYPTGDIALPLRIRAAVTDDYGHTVWAEQSSTTPPDDSYLRGGSIPVAGKIDDLSSYRVKRRWEK